MLISGIIEFCEITVSGKISVVSVATYELLQICCSKGIWGHLCRSWIWPASSFHVDLSLMSLQIQIMIRLIIREFFSLLKFCLSRSEGSERLYIPVC